MHIRTLFHDYFNRRGNVTTFQAGKVLASCISDKVFKFSFYVLLKFHHISKNDTGCVLHVATITLFWLGTFMHTYIYAHIHTHTNTHTHTHTQTLTQIYILRFFGKIAKLNIRTIGNWDNAHPRNLIHTKSCF